MSTYAIGEIAERSGFSASSLRYYEGIGLVTPAGRTEAGYRVYDDHTLARLAFIARAKQLGCSLEEIADLVSIWDGERCGPVQHRFHELVTTRIADANRQIAELAALVAQLEYTAEQLAGPAVDGPCGEGCACLRSRHTTVSEERASRPSRVRLDVCVMTTPIEHANAPPLERERRPRRRARRFGRWLCSRLLRSHGCCTRLRYSICYSNGADSSGCSGLQR